MKDNKNEFDIAMEMEEPQIDGAEIVVGDADEDEVEELLKED